MNELDVDDICFGESEDKINAAFIFNYSFSRKLFSYFCLNFTLNQDVEVKLEQINNKPRQDQRQKSVFK